MWLLARVGSNMHRQGTSLDEALSAAWMAARVRPLIRMNAVVSLQVGLAIETLGAIGPGT
jgi:hypothetical protein